MSKKRQKRTPYQQKKEPYSILFSLSTNTNPDVLKNTLANFLEKLQPADQILLLDQSKLPVQTEELIPEHVQQKEKIKVINETDLNASALHENVIFVSGDYLTTELSYAEILHQNIQPADEITAISLPDNNSGMEKAPVLMFKKQKITDNLYFVHSGIQLHNVLNFLAKRKDWKAVNLTLQKQAEEKKKGKSISQKIPAYIKLWYLWMIKEPIDLNLKQKTISFDNDAPFFRLAFLFIAVVSFFAMAIFSKDAGISGDEPVNYQHAGYVYNYFTEGDSAALETPKTKLQYYGQSFDNLTYMYNKVTGTENYYETRHFFNAVTGWLAMLFTGILVVYLMGWRAGTLAFLLILFSPRFLGHSWNNPKDIPFAMSYIFCLFFQIKLLAELPRLKASTLLFLALGIGLSISVRIGGLLLIAYQFLFLAVYVVLYKPFKKTTKPAKNFIYSGLALAGVSVAGYFLGLLLWPYALQDPIKNPLESLEVMTNFTASLKQAFMGDIIWSDNVPWFYTPAYIFVTTPLVILAGVVLYFFTIWKHPRKKVLLTLFVAFVFIFPIFYIIYKSSNVYGGWRHVLFAFAPLVVISSIGINNILNVSPKKIRPYLLLLVIALLAQPIYHTFKNHPYQYIYFNQLAGGVGGAYGKYEMDYYYHSLKENSEWVIDNVVERNTEEEVIIATNHAEILRYYFRDYEDKVNIRYVRFYDRGNYDWDYAIIANSYINPYQQEKGYWPPTNTIHEVKVNKAVVGAVIERKDKNDHIGYQAMKNKNLGLAAEHLRRAVQADPNNEVARLNLAKIYIEMGNLEQATEIVNETLKIYQNYDKALNLLGIIYLKQRQYNHAMGVFNRITQINPKFVNAYHNIGVALLNQKKHQQALDYFQKAIETNPKYKPSYLAIAHILKQAGKEEDAQRYLEAANKL